MRRSIRSICFMSSLPEHRATIEEIRKFYESMEKNVPCIMITPKSQKIPLIDRSNSLESEHLNESKKKDD